MPWWIWLLIVGSIAEALLGVFFGWFLAMTSGQFQARALREAMVYVSQFTDATGAPIHRNGHSSNGHKNDLRGTADKATSRNGGNS